MLVEGRLGDVGFGTWKMNSQNDYESRGTDLSTTSYTTRILPESRRCLLSANRSLGYR